MKQAVDIVVSRKADDLPRILIDFPASSAYISSPKAPSTSPDSTTCPQHMSLCQGHFISKPQLPASLRGQGFLLLGLGLLDRIVLPPMESGAVPTLGAAQADWQLASIIAPAPFLSSQMNCGSSDACHL